MSTGELRRAEVLGRVKSKALRLTDAAKILELSYRQTKRLWKRYRGEGAKGLQHRSAGKGSNRAKPEEFRRKVMQLIRKKYSGTEQEGLRSMEFPGRCTRIGRTSISGSPRKESDCKERRPRRSSDACASDWRSA